jgi:HEAT repeat protein
LAACAVVLTISLICNPDRDPVYQGKRLSEWLRAHEIPHTSDERDAAADAIRHLGTNAVPCLANWVSYEPWEWTVRLQGILSGRRLSYLRLREESQQRLAWDSMWGFNILGPVASSAIPELNRVANDPSRNESRFRAIRALGYIGKETFASLLEIAEGQDNRSRQEAAIEIVDLYRAGVDIEPAVPSLLLIDHATAQFQKAHPGLDLYFASSSLWERPTVFASYLTNCLHHTNSTVRFEAVERLGWARAYAALTVPALRKSLEDPDVLVREEVTNALHRIAPEEFRFINAPGESAKAAGKSQ